MVAMNLTIRNVPEEVCAELRRAAQQSGCSLNTQIVQLLTAEAEALERRRRMRQSRKELERFVASLPALKDSTPLIRQNRDR